MFEKELSLILMKECSMKSKKLRDWLEDNSTEIILCIAETTLMHNCIIKFKVIAKLLRGIDAEQSKKHAKSKMPEHWMQIDIDVRNIFMKK